MCVEYVCVVSRYVCVYMYVHVCVYVCGVYMCVAYMSVSDVCMCI